MQIESLKVFCDLAETESFTRAAQINSVTQSAVSQQISSLEKQFKSLLIERSKKKFRLTREGQVLYEYSKQIIQTFDSLQPDFRAALDRIYGPDSDPPDPAANNVSMNSPDDHQRANDM